MFTKGRKSFLPFSFQCTSGSVLEFSPAMKEALLITIITIIAVTNWMMYFVANSQVYEGFTLFIRINALGPYLILDLWGLVVIQGHLF